MQKTLYALDSKGREKIWKVSVIEHEDCTATMTKEYGLKEGKLQSRPKFFKEGKAGRTPLEQAMLEAKSAIKKQRDQGYYEAGEDTSNRPVLPMLAKTYDPTKVTFPVMAQEKLNGVRCIAYRVSEGEIRLTSRKGLEWTTQDHIKDELMPLMEVGEIWDGEIYKNGLSLQQISSATKKLNKNTPTLEYWVYDRINEKPFKERTFSMDTSTEHVRPVFTWIFYDEYRLDKYYEETVEAGGEGIMVRNPDGLYRTGLYRSDDLMKRKKFLDEEFPIVGFDFDVDGCVIWQCEVETDTEPVSFNVVPMGSKESRQIRPEDAMEMIGEELTVRFSEKSDCGVSQGNPVGIAIRNFE